jgi:CheY-like chemotaxis protein
MTDRRTCTQLRVLIIGQRSSFEHILTTNIKNWGHEALVVPTPSTNAEGDILLYDLDEAPRISIGAEGNHAEAPAHAILSPLSLEGNEGNNSQTASVTLASWLPVRFTIALSSQSVSRSTLEQMGAVALLQKPFEMGRLQRYLRVLQRLLLEPEAIRPLGARRRVLVVDDDIAIANAVRQCLIVSTDYEVAVAHDGLEALEQCLDWRPHCIITDLIMPWMNGYQVMRCLNAVSLHTRPAFVIMSALNQFEVPWNRSYMRGNRVEYVDKPFNIDHLLAVVEQVCLYSV